MQQKPKEVAPELPADILSGIEDMTSEVLALEEMLRTIAAGASYLVDTTPVSSQEPVH